MYGIKSVHKQHRNRICMLAGGLTMGALGDADAGMLAPRAPKVAPQVEEEASAAKLLREWLADSIEQYSFFLVS